MELLAAAHASCICGTVVYLLEKAGHPADMVETSATVELEPREGITGIRVTVRGVVPGISADQFARGGDTCQGPLSGKQGSHGHTGQPYCRVSVATRDAPVVGGP